MEEKATQQLKRLYSETKQAINECTTFLTPQELERILLTPEEEEFIEQLNGSQVSLVRAATLLRELHARFLRTFILSAFDLTWDMMSTPKRFQYAKEKELELYQSLNRMADIKQEEIKEIIKQESNVITINDPIEVISSRSEIEQCRREIQEAVLRQLNEAIASKLVESVDSLRNSYVGTLERCLASLEQNFIDHQEAPNALLALRQILNAAYRVEVNVQSSTSILRVLWEKMKQLISKSFMPRIWTNYGVINDEWKRQQALEIIEKLDESRLAKSICSQFRARLKLSHEQFLQSIRDLELQHAGRLQYTEELRLRVRKMHAPRMAKFALESTSLIDLIIYGMPCLEKEIGRGQYGVVYACESWAGHSPCAVKSVVPPDDKHWNDLAMEFYYTRCIPEHERIVSIFGSVIDHSYGSGSTPAVLLVMQRLNRDLYSAIKSGLDWLLRLQIAIDVVEGIRFLHNQGLVHRDIKLKNILLDENNRAKITDLGFCKPEAMMSGSVVGTPIHMSPELFSGRYDNSVDVYAFGILFWYICAGHVRLPHIFEQCQTRDQLWNCVRRGVRPERLPQFDNECWQLMVQCWDGDKTKRPHLGDVEIKLRQIKSSEAANQMDLIQAQAYTV
uniref:Dual serine/threonine and tyrosine protein kinase n=2 Tax=Aceria tosichella TaxID=561515 RepID=A0A6G1SCT3_9ACAR